MSPNRTSVWKVMTSWISIKLLLFNFKCLDILCVWVGHPSEKLWPLEFLESFWLSISSVSVYYVPESDIHVKSYDNLNFSRASVVQFCASRYVMRLNRISVWNAMTIWISRELPFFDSERLSILYPRIEHPCEKLRAFDFLESCRFSIRASRYIMSPNRTFEWKVMTIWVSRELPLFNIDHCSISSVSIYYAP